MNYYLLGSGVLFVFIGYFLTRLIFDLLLRGFAPFIPSRPWVVEELLAELPVLKEDAACLAFSTGRSGFFHALEKKYPRAFLVGHEHNIFPYVVAKIQAMIKPTGIRIAYGKIHHAPVKAFDLIYCHLNPEDLRGIGKKLKFECRPDTVIVSTGFNIPDLLPFKIVPLEDRKGKFDWLSKNQKLFQFKSKKYKKEKKAYFYRI